MQEIFSPHLSLAKKYWKEHLKQGDSAVDATCGNGHDTLFLSQLLLSDARSLIAAYDIQTQAIQNTKALLKRHLPPNRMERVLFHPTSHTEIEKLPLTPNLIVYNLGYLPGADKSITTHAATTIESVEKSLPCLSVRGALSITCYPGHAEGEKEEKALLLFVEKLSPSEWMVQYHKWPNRPRSPTLLWILKRAR